MEEALYTFSPDNSPAAMTAWAAAAIALAALGGMVAMLKKKAEGRQRNQNMLAAMLLFFVLLIAGGAAVFSWLKIRKTVPVVIYEDAIRTPYGKALFKDIRDAYIHADKQPSLVDPGRSIRMTKMLVIEEAGGKAHIMAEGDYPINEILSALKSAVQDWQKEREK